MERKVRYCTTEDGVRIAYCVAGRGQPVVWSIGVLASHVQREWDFDVLGDVYRAVASRFTLVRFDPQADGGEILVADTVRGRCSGKGLLFADRGEFVAKGFEEPVRVYEVRGRE